jgi:hypothetical protein
MGTHNLHCTENNKQLYQLRDGREKLPLPNISILIYLQPIDDPRFCGERDCAKAGWPVMSQR